MFSRKRSKRRTNNEVLIVASLDVWNNSGGITSLTVSNTSLLIKIFMLKHPFIQQKKQKCLIDWIRLLQVIQFIISFCCISNKKNILWFNSNFYKIADSISNTSCFSNIMFLRTAKDKNDTLIPAITYSKESDIHVETSFHTTKKAEMFDRLDSDKSRTSSMNFCTILDCI